MNAENMANPIDLAREPDFSIGVLSVRPSLRQAQARGASETLEPRVLQVLIALRQRPGEVVSRDELIQRCWGGRIVGEDAITRAIVRVRKLGEASGAFAVETIPRVGYRLLAMAGAATPVAGPAGDAAAPASAAGPARGWLLSPVTWAAAGVIALVVGAAVLLRPPEPNVDEIVARLSDRLREQPRSRLADAEQTSEAVRTLGASGRQQERSAFEALASDDGVHALDLLEDLARQLEVSGDLKAAAQAYTRMGAIAPLFDPARAIYAQRKAFELNPASLRNFQNLFFISFLGDEKESTTFAAKVLADQRISERMRGWVLSNRAFIEADTTGQPELAEPTLAEIKALKTFATDPVLQACVTWIEAVIAFGKGEMEQAQTLAERAQEQWRDIPERTSSSPEILLIRILHERGDWAGAFALGSAAFERRSREGDLLPAVVNWTICEAGVLSGQEDKALSYCASTVRRMEGSPALVKGQGGLVAVLEGDAVRAAREFELAQGLVPPGGSIPAIILIYEAWAAARQGDVAEAERLLRKNPAGQTWDKATKRRPAVLAMSRRLLGQWLIAANQPQRACGPLAEAARIYVAYGGDAGRSAVMAMQARAGCR